MLEQFFLGALFAHWTSQHRSLFTVAHAKPPLHLKSLQHVVNSLPKGSLHFPPSWVYSLSKTQKKKIAIVLLQEVLFSDSNTLFLWGFFSENWQTCSGFHSAGCVCAAAARCAGEKNRSSNSLSLKSDVKSQSIRASIHMVQITQKGKNKKGRKKENYKRLVKLEKEMKNPFEVLGNVSQICLQIAADSISKAGV